MAARSGTITEATVARTASHDNLYCESEEEDTSDEESRLTEVRVGSPHSVGLAIGCVNMEIVHLLESLSKWTNKLTTCKQRFSVIIFSIVIPRIEFF